MHEPNPLRFPASGRDVMREPSTAEDAVHQWPDDVEFDETLMRSPLAAQLRVVEHRIGLMMSQQGVSHPSELEWPPTSTKR
jgi:hypothetical protein